MGRRYTGRAIVFRKPLCAEVHEGVLFPEMDDNGVVLRTLFSGISRGTEMDLYEGWTHARPPHSQWYPLLPGYMPVGEVIEVGRAVGHLKVGDIAVGSNLFTGFDERYCPAWAGHTEYAVISEHSHALGARRAVPVPAGMDLRTASVALLAAIAYHGISAKVSPRAGETALVIGMGGIGHCAVQLCKAAGCRVIAADLSEYRLEQARLSGADVTVPCSRTDLWEAVAQLCGEGEPQIIIEVTGEPKVLEDCLRHAPWNGRVHAQGMYLQPLSLYMPETLFGRNLTFTSTVGEQPDMVARVFELILAGRLKLDHLVSRVFRVEQAPQAYEWVYGNPEQCITAVFEW